MEERIRQATDKSVHASGRADIESGLAAIQKPRRTWYVLVLGTLLMLGIPILLFVGSILQKRPTFLTSSQSPELGPAPAPVPVRDIPNIGGPLRPDDVPELGPVPRDVTEAP